VASLESLIKNTKAAALNDKVLQRVLQSVHTDTDERIFKKGLASDGSRIGRYTKSYVKYGRKAEGWGSSRKVILQLTGAMQTDWKFLVLPNGQYGSGFTSSVTSESGKTLTNYEKSFIVENTYNKKIFALTDAEDKSISVKMDKELTRFLSKL
jgi:hypothetical protein